MDVKFKIKLFVYVIGATIFLFLINGCSRSLISIQTDLDDSAYSMFGKVPSRDFYYPGKISDSISLKWQAEINGSFPGSSVVIHDHYVFLNDLSGRIFCFDINNGKIVGQLKHKGAVFTTPILENMTVLYAYALNDENSSCFVVYNFSQGKSIAESEHIGGVVLTDMIKIEDGVVFTTENGKIFKYSFIGDKKFEYSTRAYSHSAPSVSKNILVFGNDKGEIIAFDIKEERLLYREKISAHLLAGVSISGDTVFAGDYSGVLYALNINDGNIIWSYNTGKRIDMIPAFDSQNVYIGNLAGEMFALEKGSGKMLWKTITSGVLTSTPLITDNYLVTPDLNKKLHFIDKIDGSIKKSFEFEGKVKLSPVYFDNLLFIGYDNGILEAYEIIN